MSENIPLPQSSSASSIQPKRSKRKYDKNKLPTPPPDPTETNKEAQETKASDAQKEKDELMEYLEHLQKSTPGLSRSSSIFAPALIAEDAFLHLEKLYKLMEQLLELREQNAKLHRRVRDLEHINNLEKMHKHLDLASLGDIKVECPCLDRDTALAEGFLESILAESKKDANVKPKPSAPARLRHSILRRNRSGSGTEKNLDIEQSCSRRTSTCTTDDRNKPAKVSKWTKVKAAFKWEKASVADAKSQDSGLSGMVPVNPVNLEVARYLRVPSTSEDTGHSPADSGAAGISTPGTLSTASSAEDFHRSDLRSPCEDFRSSDDEYNQNYIPHSKDEQSASQKSSLKSHRTPWAKMKDIIQTRNSVKKKNRLSTHSDDIQIDIELCSDNEEVFEDDVRVIRIPQINSQVEEKVQGNENDIPREIIERYQKALAEENTNLADFDPRKSSKWTRVKKAFLQNDERKISESKSDDEIKNIQAEINRNYKELQKKLSLEFQGKLSEWERMKQHSPGTSNPSSICGFSDEAHDPAFIKKMEEWQRIKGQPPRNRPSITTSAEENLAPEFKKRLEEWNKMQKSTEKPSTCSQAKRKLGDLPRWKSVSGPRTDHSPSFEYPAISEEFRKKLEEWRQIKASGGPPSFEDNEHKKSKENKSPKLARKNSSAKNKKSQKESREKELQWFEKELNKIEKEKQRLERERQKFLEREERLAKLRNSVIGDKKEVLIHTPSGFYRFEGISKKFAEKLYEWEKAQGIAPEASTFALLNSQCSTDSKAASKHNSAGNTPPLVRSKSADSVAVSNSSLCPLTNAQLSSLSLNDMEELEKQCMEDLNSSLQYLSNYHESMDQYNDRDEPLDQDEPEALIVEVEDIIEETASPLHTYMDRQQQPIYQREEIKAICEGETCAAPKVRRSESAKAQVNYNIIEELSSLLTSLSDNENEIEKYDTSCTNEITKQGKLKALYEAQTSLSAELSDKLSRLQEANTTLMNSARESSNCSSHNSSQIEETLDQIQDLSSEVSRMVEKLNMILHNRNIGHIPQDDQNCTASSHNIIEELRDKLFQLRRHLSYFCAASDVTAPERKKGSKYKKSINKTTSNESRDSKTETDMSRGSSDKSSATNRLYTKAANPNNNSNNQSQGAIKKRIKYRQKNLQTRILPDTDEEEEFNNDEKKKPRKLTRTRSVSENNSFDKADDINEKTNETELKFDEEIMKKIVIPTQTASFLNLQNSSCSQDELSDTPVTVFVKTTRKLFTPIVESQLIQKSTTSNKETSENTIKEDKNLDSSSKPGIHEESNPHKTKNIDTKEAFSKNASPLKEESPAKFEGLPPLPTSSPISQRRTKEISPNIRMMLVKYNQKVSEKEGVASKSGGSSGSASPVAWRSPVLERRVRTQTEKFQEAIEKNSPKMNNKKLVKKSSSASHLQNDQTASTSKAGKNIRIQKDDGKSYDISKSSSVGMITCRHIEERNTLNTPSTNTTDKKHPELKVIINRESTPTFQSLELRKRKIQKAKEEFFQSSPLSAPPELESEALKFPTRNRLSQISVESGSSIDSSCAGLLMKSASAGMINIEPNVYRQIDPELHGGGYVSLPRSSKQSKQGFLGGKFAISNITSKFRKVRMKKGKERESPRLNAVSALCRHSLVVDINKNDSEKESNTESGRVSSEDPSPSTSRSSSWIKKPKFFKK